MAKIRIQPASKESILLNNKIRIGLLANSIGSIMHLLELIWVAYILSTRPFFKCIRSFGGDCRSLWKALENLYALIATFYKCEPRKGSIFTRSTVLLGVSTSIPLN